MNRIAQFEKVSKEQFYKDITSEFGRRFTDEEINEIYENIKLPKRSTSGSAGYDLFSPFDFTLAPTEILKIPTGIRVKIDDGWFLGIVPRSGLGFKYFETIANTFPVIDSDYYNSDNEGHIWIKIVNRYPTASNEHYSVSPELLQKRTMKIEQGQGFVQGIFLIYGITVDDDADVIRNGGLGSTDK